jgi:hypothetical protein
MPIGGPVRAPSASSPQSVTGWTGDVPWQQFLINALPWKDTVRVVATSNVNIASHPFPGDVIDGVTLAEGDAVLLTAQTAPEENGIYLTIFGSVSSGPAGRRGDASDSVGMVSQLAVFVEEGTTYAGSLWHLTTAEPITVDTTPLTFSQFTSGGGGGTVTSVGLSMPAEYSVAGSPVTTAGTLAVTWATEAANKVLAGPTSGGAATPGFRLLVAGDIPALSYVTSVGLSLPGEFSVSGSPVTSSGTLTATWVSETQHAVFAAPSGSSGTPSFRALVAGDIPALAYVTSVGLSLPAEFTVSGSPVTSSGTLTATWASETQNFVFAAPSGSSGTPSFRALVAGDIPALSYVTSVALSAPSEFSVSGSPVTSSGTLTFAWANPVSIAHGGTGATSFTAGSVVYAGASTLTQDNSNFFWDGSGHNLGLGLNSSIASRLHVKDTSNGVQITAEGSTSGINNGAQMQWKETGTGANNWSLGTGYGLSPGNFVFRDDTGTTKYIELIPASTLIGIYERVEMDVPGSDTTAALFLNASTNNTKGMWTEYKNNTGDLKYGVEGTTTGNIMTGSSAYAAVINCVANEPLQFGTNDTFVANFTAAGDLVVAAKAITSARQSGAFYIGLQGSTLSSRFELSSARTDADATAMGEVDCADPANVTDTDKRIGAIQFLRDGGTSARRGGRIQFLPRADNSSALGSVALLIDKNGNVVMGTAALSTSATDGFFYIDSCAGTPTGTPTAFTGRVPTIVDTTGNKIWGYYGGVWVNLSPAAGGGSGNITSTGAQGSEPGSPTTGDLYFPNNAFATERYSGSAWVKWGPIFPFSGPHDPGTWLNQGTATVDTTNGSLYILVPSAATRTLRAREETYGSGNKKVTAYLTMDIDQATTQTDTFVGLEFRQNQGVNSGRIVQFGIYQADVNGLLKFVIQHNTASGNTFGSTVQTNNIYFGYNGVFKGIWMRIYDDNTNLVCDLSVDGQHWRTCYTEGRASYLTAPPDVYGAFVSIGTSSNGKTVGGLFHSLSFA